jgi:hypothetical protein
MKMTVRIFVATYRDKHGNNCEAHFMDEHLARKFIENAPYDDIDQIYTEIEI